MSKSVLVPLVVAATLLTACASAPEAEGPPRREMLLAVTQDHQLIRFNAGQPRRILDRKPLLGLPTGDTLVGIDYRVARGLLYGLSHRGQLFTIDAASGRMARIGNPPPAAPPQGRGFGFDFNPAADRIRVVAGQLNLRLHPDTGQTVDGDPDRPGVQPDAALTYTRGDTHEGRRPDLAGAAYTYNRTDDKLTTNYAIDRSLGTLVLQGSREGVQPVLSPNGGQLRTVGALGLGPLSDAALDIADVSNAAFAALRPTTLGGTRLYEVDLASGHARFIGTVGDGAPIRGLAVEP